MSGEAFVLVGVVPALRTMFREEQLQRLGRAHPRVRVEAVDTPEQFAALLPRADGVLLWPSYRLPPEVLAPGTRLRWVHSIPAGVPASLLSPALVAAERVTVTSSKGPMGPLMAEHVVLLMLALARSLPAFLADRAERRWRFLSADQHPMVQLYGRTVAILGLGAVGGALARACRLGFGMRVLGMARTRRDDPHVDRYFDRSDLRAALGEADFVALCLPLTPETTHLIDGPALAAMKPTAFLINVARGQIVDEGALVEALQAGRIAGAGLDTTDTEPPAPDNPLWSLPNVILTPHVAPARDRVDEHVVDFWCENLRRFGEGEALLGIVDRHAGY